MVGIGSIWLRIGTGGGLMWTRWWTSGFHKMLRSSWVAAQLAASREGLGSSEWVSESQEYAYHRLRNTGIRQCCFGWLGMRTCPVAQTQTCLPFQPIDSVGKNTERTGFSVFWATASAFYRRGRRKPQETSVSLACLQLEVKTMAWMRSQNSNLSVLTFDSPAWFESEFVWRHWIFSKYTPSTMGRRLRHRRLVTYAFTSSLDRY
jgi:hypothetical protein